jgi:hypothetical protein
MMTSATIRPGSSSIAKRVRRVDAGSSVGVRGMGSVCRGEGGRGHVIAGYQSRDTFYTLPRHLTVYCHHVTLPSLLPARPPCLSAAGNARDPLSLRR